MKTNIDKYVRLKVLTSVVILVSTENSTNASNWDQSLYWNPIDNYCLLCFSSAVEMRRKQTLQNALRRYNQVLLYWSWQNVKYIFKGKRRPKIISKSTEPKARYALLITIHKFYYFGDNQNLSRKIMSNVLIWITIRIYTLLFFARI